MLLAEALVDSISILPCTEWYRINSPCVYATHAQVGIEAYTDRPEAYPVSDVRRGEQRSAIDTCTVGRILRTGNGRAPLTCKCALRGPYASLTAPVVLCTSTSTKHAACLRLAGCVEALRLLPTQNSPSVPAKAVHFSRSLIHRYHILVVTTNLCEIRSIPVETHELTQRLNRAATISHSFQPTHLTRPPPKWVSLALL